MISDAQPKSDSAFMYHRHDAVLKQDPMGHATLVAMYDELTSNK
jgi:hypothetical protein